VTPANFSRVARYAPAELIRNQIDIPASSGNTANVTSASFASSRNRITAVPTSVSPDDTIV
jgi:hypothetical protein